MSQSERINRVMGSMTQFDEDEASDFIKGFVNEITEPVKNIPENVFREIFLPVFAGLSPDQENRIGDFTAHWVGIVGSPTEPANIVNMQGDVLFKVPPIYDTSRMNQEGSVAGAESYKSIFGNLVDGVVINPIVAVGEFGQAITKRLDAVIKHDEVPVDQNPWKPVFAFYGLIEKNEGTDSASNNQTSLDDDFKF